MRLRLTAYANGGFFESRLPAIDNADYELTIAAVRLSLDEDLIVSLEVIQGAWKVREREGYRLFAGERPLQELLLDDGQIFSLQSARGCRVTFIASQQDSRLPAMEKFEIGQAPCVTIGKSSGCHIRYDFQNLVSRNHAALVRDGNGHVIEDASVNGVFVGKERVQGRRRLAFGDCIHILGLKVVYLGNVLAINQGETRAEIDDTVLKPYRKAMDALPPARATDAKKQYFKRSPREIPQLHTDAVEIEAPPPPNKQRKQPLLLVIGPAFTMMIPMLLGSGMAIFSASTMGANAGAFMYTGIITAVSAALLGVMWALINVRYAKKQQKEEEQLRFTMYRNYLIKIADQIKQQYAENAQRLHERYPSAENCAGYLANAARLWNRNTSHSDFLFVRLGIGQAPFQVPIQIPKERFTLDDDELAEKPRLIKENYAVLRDVPVGMDLLATRLVGIYENDAQEDYFGIARAMAVQLAANNCYTDVKLVFLLTPQQAELLSCVKWLPHVWSQDRKFRYVATNRGEAHDVLFALANVLRVRSEESTGAFRKNISKPHYVVFVGDLDLLEGEPAAKYLLEPEEELGVSTLLFAKSYETLPNCCSDLIQKDEAFHGMYDVRTVDTQRQPVVFDRVCAAPTETFFRYLSALRVNELESGGSLPTTLTFFDMHQITALPQLQVQERWRKNRTYESMKALVGQKAGGQELYLDIHEKYYGPHGLVAGTTGSGKSEMLQTYMLSLAINFSPLDVGFFIIDYKGGGMANLFSDLPHMVGQISNLSGNQVRRAMVSINSEIKRRQRIFGEYDVNHLDMYTRLLKNNEATIPLPHLLIIIDEFAELKREEPDFMRELISVAQVGRSLGIHLILATQKPSGNVDENIWSNARFKLCLRVQERQDSMDMLKRPDAAYLTQAGRCYLQVGNDEIFELFQSGWSGAAYDEDLANAKADLATMLSATGQPSLVGNRSRMKRKELKRSLWIQRLIACVRQGVLGLSYALTDCLHDSKALADVTVRTFEQIAALSIDYPYNPSNAHRIEEFITLMAELSEQESLDNAFAEKLLAKAAKKGVKLPELKEKTQLAAVVEHLAKEAAQSDMRANLSLWLPVLPRMLILRDLFGFEENRFANGAWRPMPKEWELRAVAGLCDDPINQAQMPLAVNFAEDGHLAVCGMVVSGKSTFVQTLLYSLVSRYAPDALNFYVLDFSSRILKSFDGLAHCGGVVFEDQPEKTGKLFALLKKELDRRKKLFAGGNYAQYVRSNGLTEPAVILAIDGFANFKEKTDNRYEDVLIALSRDGANYGMFLVLTAGGFGAAEIQNRIGENIKTIVCLQMGERMKYADTLRTRVETLPEPDIKGRGAAVVQGIALEFQTALCLEADDDYQRAEKMEALFAEMNACWKGARAQAIPVIPEKPVWSLFAPLSEYASLIASDRRLPFGYVAADASVCSVDLSKVFTYVVAGRARTGKSNVLRCFMRAAADRGGDMIVLDSPGGDLQDAAAELGAAYVRTDEELAGFATSLFKEDMKVRNARKRELRKGSSTDDSMYVSMLGYPAKFIFIDNFAEFIARVYSASESMQNIVGFLENFFDKGDLHNIYVFAGMPVEQHNAVVGRKIFDLVVGRKTGVLLGGGAGEQRLFDMSGLSYQEMSKPMKVGVGLLPPGEDNERPVRVVIPLAKG